MSAHKAHSAAHLNPNLSTFQNVKKQFLRVVSKYSFQCNIYSLYVPNVFIDSHSVQPSSTMGRTRNSRRSLTNLLSGSTTYDVPHSRNRTKNRPNSRHQLSMKLTPSTTQRSQWLLSTTSTAVSVDQSEFRQRIYDELNANQYQVGVYYEDDITDVGSDPSRAGPGGRNTGLRTGGSNSIFGSTAVLTLIIVASLSLVVGLIYLLIYFKSIKPMSARSRSYKDSGGGAKGDDDGSRSKSAHPFFRHK